MPETVQPYAFKEWAGVVAALGAGEQTIILRKGGIHEKNRQFRAEHGFFYLFPTFEHQNPDDLNEKGKVYLEESRKQANEQAAFLQSHVPIRYAAFMENAYFVTDFERLLRLTPYHVLSEQAVRKRFEWGDGKGIYVLVVKVAALAEPPPVPRIAAYGGCRSWVKLERAPDASRAVPVLPGGRFEMLCREIGGLLTGEGV